MKQVSDIDVNEWQLAIRQKQSRLTQLLYLLFLFLQRMKRGKYGSKQQASWREHYNLIVGIVLIIGYSICLFLSWISFFTFCIASIATIAILTLERFYPIQTIIVQLVIYGRCRKAWGARNQPSFKKSPITPQLLYGTKFQYPFALPNHLDSIYLLTRSHRVVKARWLIDKYSAKQKLPEEIKIIEMHISSILNPPESRISKQSHLVRQNLKKFVDSLCLNSIRTNIVRVQIPQIWIYNLFEFAGRGKCNGLKRTFQEIAQEKDKDQGGETEWNKATFSIPEESYEDLLNFFSVEVSSRESWRGLANLGNTCYMNSAIQCLHKTFQLTRAIISKNHPSEFAEIYLQMMSELSKDQRSSFRPLKIKSLIAQYNPFFCGYSQHDASECLSTFLNYLHDELNEVKENNLYKIDEKIKRNDDELLMEYIKKDSLRSRSIIDDLFYGRTITTFECLDCHHEKKLFEKFHVLYLPVPNQPNVDLQDCMENFCEPDILEGDNAWQCANCEKDTPTKRYMSVYQASKILIICLKRFAENRKINSHIDFQKAITLSPLSSNQSIQDMKYDLYGVINHQGNSLTYGHYYSYCNDGDSWKQYNDGSVHEMSEKDVVTSNAFILLYRLRE